MHSAVPPKPGGKTPGGILTEGRVATVMVTVFTPRPVGSAEVDPVARGGGRPWLAGKIEALLDARLAGFLSVPCPANLNDDAARASSCENCPIINLGPGKKPAGKGQT